MHSLFRVYHLLRAPKYPRDRKACGKRFILPDQRAGFERCARKRIQPHEAAHPEGTKALAGRAEDLAAGVAAFGIEGGTLRRRENWGHAVEIVVITLVAVQRSRREAELPAFPGPDTAKVHIELRLENPADVFRVREV